MSLVANDANYADDDTFYNSIILEKALIVLLYDYKFTQDFFQLISDNEMKDNLEAITRLTKFEFIFLQLEVVAMKNSLG